ncbi:TPA: 6-phosphogluconolactonase [Neisseria bacilliformis]
MTAIRTFPSPEAAARALADAVAQDLREALAHKGNAVLAVSGGRSPVPFFQALSHEDLDWANVAATLADERVVPTSHPDSNTRLVREHLLQHRAAAAQWLPLIEDGASVPPPDEAVRLALAHYRRADVLVLGMGSDGHTASLFPAAPQLSDGLSPDCPQPLLHVSPPDAPHERVSLTLAQIARVPQAYLAIAGEDKRRVLDAALAAPSAKYPVGAVLAAARHVMVYYSP